MTSPPTRPTGATTSTSSTIRTPAQDPAGDRQRLDHGAQRGVALAASSEVTVIARSSRVGCLHRMREPVNARVNRRTTPAVIAAVVAISAAVRWRAQLRQSAGGADRHGEQHHDVDGADDHRVRARERHRRPWRRRPTPHRRRRRRRSPRRRRHRRSRRSRRHPSRRSAIGTRSSRATRCSASRKVNVRLPDLLAANGLNENSLIVPGQQLGVPQGGTVPAPTQPQPEPQRAPAGGPRHRPRLHRPRHRRPHRRQPNGCRRAAHDDVRRAGGWRRSPGDRSVVPGAGLGGGGRHADRVLARQRARSQPGDGLAV